MKYNYVIYILVSLLFILFHCNRKAWGKKQTNNESKNILVMFSGGLDSTTALCKLLKETKHNIYVHHIILKDNSNRWKDELTATHIIIKYLNKIRPFEYSESTVDLRLNSIDIKGGSRHDDISTIIFIANQICTIESYKKIDYIVISNLDCELDDLTKEYINNMINITHTKRWSAKKPIVYDALSEFNNSKCLVNINNINKLKKMAYSILIQEIRVNDITTQTFIDIICMKRKMYEYLPTELKKEIIYCRDPKNNKKCNKCFNCLLYNNIIPMTVS